MATIAIVPSDVPSKRMLATRLGERLAHAGHRVVVVVPPGDPAATSGSGAGAVEIVGAPMRPTPAAAGPRWRPIARSRATAAAARSVDLDALPRALDAAGADLAIVDVEEYEATIATLAADDAPPLVTLCSFFDPWPFPRVGPNDAGPRTGMFGRLRARLAWFTLRTRMRLFEVRQLLTAADVDRNAIARSLARRAGVGRQLTNRQWVHPFVARDHPMLVCNALELDVPHEPQADVHHIGSLLAPRDPGDTDDPLVVAAADACAAGRPVVVCSFGTVMAGTPSPLVDRLDDVARLRPDVEFFVATSDDVQQRTLGVHPNVHVAEWLPQRALLAHADAAIVHSGNATLHECVAAGVPVLVYPFTMNDQPRNAARVECHRIGAVGDRRTDDAATIARRLDGVLAGKGTRRRVAELAPAIERYEDDDVAVAVVETLLGNSGHVSGGRRSRP